MSSITEASGLESGEVKEWASIHFHEFSIHLTLCIDREFFCGLKMFRHWMRQQPLWLLNDIRYFSPHALPANTPSIASALSQPYKIMQLLNDIRQFSPHALHADTPSIASTLSQPCPWALPANGWLLIRHLLALAPSKINKIMQVDL